MKTHSMFVRYIRSFIFLIIATMSTGCGMLEHTIKLPVNNDTATLSAYATTPYKSNDDRFTPVDLELIAERQKLIRHIDDIYVFGGFKSNLRDKVKVKSESDSMQTMLSRLELSLPFKYRRSELHQLRDFRMLYFSHENSFSNNYLARENQSPTRGNILSQLRSAYDSALRSKRNTAVFVLSDWDITSSDLGAAIDQIRHENKIHSEEKNSFCIYVVARGNVLSGAQQRSLDKCGFTIPIARFYTAADIAYQLENILYHGPRDSDGDGIYDYQDKCMLTEPGRIIDFNGCQIFSSTEESEQ